MPASLTPTTEQARRVLHRCQTDPAWFAREILGVHWWSRQVEIAQAVRDYRRVAVRSAHGIGKTFTAAGLALWFLYSFPDSRVISTAPTWNGVKRLLWHELGRLYANAKVPLGGTCLDTELQLPDGRFAVGLASDPARAEAFQGHHAPNLLVIFDEASGVDRRIYEAAEGYMTTSGARALLIGNPTQSEGTFFEAFHSRRDEYHTLHVSALDSPAVTGEPVPDELGAKLTGPEWIADKQRTWGEDSPMFQVRVLGNFPDHIEDAIISLTAVEAAQQRELPADNRRDLIVIGCDVARYGSDETVITQRVGQQVRIVETYVGKPTTHTAARVAHWARQHPRPAVRIVIDDTGVGGGVTDQLRSDGWPVTAFNAGEKADHASQFPNRRSELWFQAAAQLEDLDLDPDDQLAADLTSPRYSYDLKLRRVVEKKDETKKRLGRSPDRADAVLLTLVEERSAGAIVEPHRQERRDRADVLRSDDEILNAPM